MQLSLIPTDVAGERLVHIAKVRRLQSMWFGETGITDRRIRTVVGTRRLRTRSVVDANVSEAAIVEIEQLVGHSLGIVDRDGQRSAGH